MSLPDEYDTWRCDDCLRKTPALDCKAVWQTCDDPDCEQCSGAGGGHVCIHDVAPPNAGLSGGAAEGGHVRLKP